MGKNRKSHKKIVKRKRTRTNKTIRGGVFSFLKRHAQIIPTRTISPIEAFNIKYYNEGQHTSDIDTVIYHSKYKKDFYDYNNVKAYKIPKKDEDQTIELNAGKMIQEIINGNYKFPESRDESNREVIEILFAISVCAHMFNIQSEIVVSNYLQAPDQLQEWIDTILPISKLFAELYLKLIDVEFNFYPNKHSFYSNQMIAERIIRQVFTGDLYIGQIIIPTILKKTEGITLTEDQQYAVNNLKEILRKYKYEQSNMRINDKLNNLLLGKI